jgi:hypothetical protein
MMTFEEVLDQAIAMLQRRGRVTYRTLKRQFNLDDEALEDLKEEIIEAEQLAVDQNGKMLVWAGDAPSAPTPEYSTQEPAAAFRERRRLACSDKRSGWPRSQVAIDWHRTCEMDI